VEDKMFGPVQQVSLPPAMNTRPSGMPTPQGTAVIHGVLRPVQIPHATDPKQ